MNAGLKRRGIGVENETGMRLTLTALALSATVLVALPAMPAQAASDPAIKRVSPMRAKVGGVITIRGRGFSSTRRGNTVVFRSPGKRTAFAKPRRAGRSKLVVRVPGSVERLLTNTDDKGVGSPTRFRIRVVAHRRYGGLSPRRNSPLIVSALRSGAPAICGKGSDFDRDLLSNKLEAKIKTDPCDADTDGDGVEDGFEQESARDLNQVALPYPGQRPYANALDASDAYDDYDGDGLSMIVEYRAWARPAVNPRRSLLQRYTTAPQAPAFGGPYGTRPRFGNHRLPLNYSDGDQTTLNVSEGHPEYDASLDIDGDGRLFDDERDVDGDGLRNIDESHNRGAFDENDEDTSGVEGADSFLLFSTAHYKGLPEPCEAYEYKSVLPRPMLQPGYLDWDSDGDGIWDGNDDQDNDDVSNVDETRPPYQSCGDGSAAVFPLPFGNAQDGSEVLRSPYNPCLPYRSDVCARYGPRG